jgi:hypothetical protein
MRSYGLVPAVEQGNNVPHHIELLLEAGVMSPNRQPIIAAFFSRNIRRSAIFFSRTKSTLAVRQSTVFSLTTNQH